MWFAVLPGDSRDKWPKDLLVDRRIKQFWDETKSVGSWYAKFPEYKVEYLGVEYSVLWDAFLLYGSASRWEERPSQLVGSGFPIIQHTETLEEDFRALVGGAARKENGDR